MKTTTYLSLSGGRYRVIHQGMPICADTETMADALRAAAHYRLDLSPVAWNGDLGCWVHLDTVEGAA